MRTAASVIAGLGLFFFSLNFLSQNLKLLAGRRLRERIARLTARPTSGLFVGAVLIVITQSASASVFVLVGMVRAGMLALKQVQSVILGLNAGSSIVIFFLTFDIDTGILVLIGISGIAYAYGDARTTRIVAGAALGFALLFFGLDIMRHGVAPLAAESWFLDAIRATSGSPLFAFAIGMALSVVIQSSLAAIVVMIAFNEAGIFGLPEAIMFVYGANLGGSILMLLLSARMTGVAKQVALYQVAFNFVGAAILVPLFYVETILDVPLVRHLIEAVTADSGQRIAFANLIFNIVPVLVLLATLNQSARLLQSVSPETRTEQGAKPKYLQDKRASEPAIAIPLIELEQIRLFNLLAAALASLRPDSGRHGVAEDLEAFDSLASVIDEAIADVTDGQPLAAEDYDRLDLLLRIHRDALATRISLRGLAVEITKLRQKAPGLAFPDSVVEGLDAILQFLGDVARDRSPEDIDLLLQMTSEEGNGTKSVRSAYLAGEHHLSAEDRMHLLAAANYCERLIWLFGEIGGCYRALELLEGNGRG